MIHGIDQYVDCFVGFVSSPDFVWVKFPKDVNKFMIVVQVK